MTWELPESHPHLRQLLEATVKVCSTLYDTRCLFWQAEPLVSTAEKDSEQIQSSSEQAGSL